MRLNGNVQLFFLKAAESLSGTIQS
jgi:hypothetical protein